MNRAYTTVRGWLPAASLVAAVALAGCGDVFDVTNPGQILDEDLNTVRGVQALVVGMSASLSEGYDGQSFLVARATDEMAGSGSYDLTGLVRRGIIEEEDVDGFWEDAQEARWVAEAGLQRMQSIEGYEFEGNPLTARAYLIAGLANRWLGENFCQVAFTEPFEGDTGEALPKSAAFERAIPEFEAAITHGTTAGEDAIVTAAQGGLAQAYVGLGNWDQAVQYAQMVPTDFVYEAVYSDNSGSEENEIQIETHGRYEMSAFMALAGSFVPPDPRAPYTDCRESADCLTELGADGLTPHLRQEKYPELGSDIPLVKGTEMRLIEAEAALLDGDLETFTDMINDVRTFWDLEPIDQPATAGSLGGDDGDAWTILDRERHLTLWLEGRRLWDLHRWDHPFLDGGSVIYPATGRRASCVPISFSECQTNPNIPCQTG